MGRIANGRRGSLCAATALASYAVLAPMFATLAPKPVAARAGDDQDQRGRIRTEVTLVSMLASVLDKDGRPALGLTTDQFDVYEEGVKQKIEVLEPETQQPLDLALMIDSSLSEVKELEFEEDAASRFIQKLVRPADRLGVYEFADVVTQLAPFSSNVPSLQASLRRILPGDGTALYDAIFLGSQALARNPAGRRRVIILVTDAGETTSRADFETARRAALRADALLYTIVVRAVKNEGGRNTAGEHALVGPADRAPDAGDRLTGVQQQDGGVLGAELAQVSHGGQPGSSIEQPDQVARSEMQLGRQAGQRPVPG